MFIGGGGGFTGAEDRVVDGAGKGACNAAGSAGCNGPPGITMAVGVQAGSASEMIRPEAISRQDRICLTGLAPTIGPEPAPAVTSGRKEPVLVTMLEFITNLQINTICRGMTARSHAQGH